MTDVPSKPPLRWYERKRVGLVIGFVLCITMLGIPPFCRFTLASSFSERIGAALAWAFLFGSMGFVIFVLPVQWFIILTLGWLKVWPRWKALLSTLPFWVLLFCTLSDTLNRFSPAGERAWVEQSIGVPPPEKSRLILAQHSCGPAVRQHLWLFEGHPDDFDRFVAQRGWMTVDEQHLPRIPELIQTRIKTHFDSQWQPDLIFSWGTTNPVQGPLGASCLDCLLLSDKERKRWVVYVID